MTEGMPLTLQPEETRELDRETHIPSLLANRGSLRERLAARRRELEQDRTFVLPVLGYEDLGIYARYRVLPYEALRKIGERNQALEGTPEGEMTVAADTLAQACLELLERNEDGDYVSLGVRWSRQAAEELFEVILPEGATARAALRAVYGGPSGGTTLMLHFKAYDDLIGGAIPQLDEAIRGNSHAGPTSS